MFTTTVIGEIMRRTRLPTQDGKVQGAALYGYITTGVGKTSFFCVLGGVGANNGPLLSPEACTAIAQHIGVCGAPRDF